MPTVLRGHVKHLAFSCDESPASMEQQIEDVHNHPVQIGLCEKGEGRHWSSRIMLLELLAP